MSLELLYISIQIAVFAVIFSCLLIEEGQIFSFYGRLLGKLPTWIGSPLGLCVYCFGGQIAAWYYPIFMDGYEPEMHVFFVAITIFLIHLTLYLYERTNS